MTASKKDAEAFDRLVELHIDLSERFGAAARGQARWSADPVLPRVLIPARPGDPNLQLLELSERVLEIYDRWKLPTDLAILTLRAAVQGAIEESLA